MAERITKEETFINALAETLQHRAGLEKFTSWAEIQAVVTIMRTLGYTTEIEYSRMMTLVTQRSGERTVRHDGSETIELARIVRENPIDTIRRPEDVFGEPPHEDSVGRSRPLPHRGMDPETILPSEP